MLFGDIMSVDSLVARGTILTVSGSANSSISIVIYSNFLEKYIYKKTP
jgi:hypothetical protein